MAVLAADRFPQPGAGQRRGPQASTHLRAAKGAPSPGRPVGTARSPASGAGPGARRPPRAGLLPSLVRSIRRWHFPWDLSRGIPVQIVCWLSGDFLRTA